MLKIINKGCTPPGGYSYVDPNTKFATTASNLAELIKKATAHRIANSLTVNNLPSIVEDSLCQTMPDGICRDEDGSIPLATGIRLPEVVLNSTAAFDKLARNQGTVDQAEADARALICIACPQNKPFGGCPSCRGIASFVKQISRGRSVRVGSRLKMCAAVGMLQIAMVFVKKDVVIEVMKSRLKTKYPSQCWLNEVQ